MLANSTSPKNYNIYWNNDTSEDISVIRDQKFVSSLLSNGGDYSIAVTRLNLPSNRIKTFKTTTPNDYSVGLKIHHANNSSESGEYSCTLPSNGYSNGVLVGSTDVYSDNDMVSNINNMYVNAYADYVKSFGANYKSESLEIHGVFDGSASTYTFDMPVATSANNSFAYAELMVYSMCITDASNSWTNFLDPKPPTYNKDIHFTLSNDATFTKQCSLLNFQSAADFDWYNGAGNNLFITDRAFNSATKLQYVFTTETVNQRIKPAESLFKFHDVSSINSTWKLKIHSESGVNFRGLIAFRFNVYCVPDNYPRIPPAIALDSDHKLSILYDKQYVTSGVKLFCSTKMHNMINFHNQDEYIAPYWFFNYPPLILSADTLTYTQNASTKYHFSNIQRIGVLTYNMPIDGESSDQQTNNNLLTDFTISNQDDLNQLEYNVDSVFWRKYDLVMNGSLNRISLQIDAIYSDNSTDTQETVKLSPGSSAFIRITFIPI